MTQSINYRNVWRFRLHGALVAFFVVTAAHQSAARTWAMLGKIESGIEPPGYIVSPGAGANITVQAHGDNAVYMVDAGLPTATDQVISAVRQLSKRPIAYIIDTNADADHVGGNASLAKAGRYDTGQPGERSGAGIGANLNVLDRLTAEKRPLEELPTDTFQHPWSLFNDEALVLTHAPAAHSDGDTYVFFRRSDVISTGDLFNPSLYPVVRADEGGTVDRDHRCAERHHRRHGASENRRGRNYLIPGHGRVCDRTDIVNYRDAIYRQSGHMFAIWSPRAAHLNRSSCEAVCGLRRHIWVGFRRCGPRPNSSRPSTTTQQREEPILLSKPRLHL